MIYSVGMASGGHINPAVSIAMWSAGRMSLVDAVMYIVYQLIGAVIGAGILYAILKGKVRAPASIDRSRPKSSWAPDKPSGRCSVSSSSPP